MTQRRALAFAAVAVVIGVAGIGVVLNAGDEDSTPETTTTTSPGLSVTTTDPDAPFICPEYTASELVEDLDDSRITEASGIVESAERPGVFWVHNDSGDIARVFGVTESGDTLVTLVLAGADAQDIEGIGYRSTAEGNQIYLADVGDNGRNRAPDKRPARIFRVTEPPLSSQENLEGQGDITVGWEAITVAYDLDDKEKPPNVEAFFVDPIRGDLVIIQKNLKDVDGRPDQSFIWVADGDDFVDGATVRFERASAATTKIDFPNNNGATGADISPDGTRIIVRNPKEGFIWPRDPTKSVAETFTETPDPPCVVPVGKGAGEAIAWRTDGSNYITISEGSQSPIDLFTPQSP